MTYILNAENPPLMNIISPLRPFHLSKSVKWSRGSSDPNQAESIGTSGWHMYAWGGGGRNRAVSTLFGEHLNLLLKAGSSQGKTMIFAYTCGHVVCTNEHKVLWALWQIPRVSWGAGLVGLDQAPSLVLGAQGAAGLCSPQRGFPSDRKFQSKRFKMYLKLAVKNPHRVHDGFSVNALG